MTLPLNKLISEKIVIERKKFVKILGALGALAAAGALALDGKYNEAAGVIAAALSSSTAFSRE